MTMRVPTDFRALAKESLANARAMTADKAMLLAGNTGWLYEGYMDRPVPGNDFISNQRTFDHTGKGRGRPLPVVVNVMRGLYRAGEDFSQAIRLVGNGSEQLLTSVVPSFATGKALEQDVGWNWRRTPTIPFFPHRYVICLRTVVEVRRVSGSGEAKIFPVVSADPAASSRVLEGGRLAVNQASFSKLELTVDFTNSALGRGLLPLEPWYWGLRVWIPDQTVIEVRDSDETGPCLALSSV